MTDLQGLGRSPARQSIFDMPSSFMFWEHITTSYSVPASGLLAFRLSTHEGKPMLLIAFVCLWVGFAAGFVCAALMRDRGDDNGHRLDATEPEFRHVVTWHPTRRPREQAEERTVERDRF